MLKILKDQHRLYQTKFSFGATSAVITSLGLITGLDTMAHARMSIIGGILIIAVADNISDSVAIHIHQESECVNEKEVWFSTATNFLARLIISATFILLVAVLPINTAVFCSMFWGLSLLAAISYTIAKTRKLNPYLVVFEHLVIAVCVIAASHFFGRLFIKKF